MSARMAELVKRLESPLITIRVGQGAGARDFHVPQGILCACSDWFTNALKDGRFIEGTAKLINLPEDTARVFEAFVVFAYEGILTFPNDYETPEICGEAFHFALDIWNFGEKYMLPYLQNAAVTSACYFIKDETIPMTVLSACFDAAATETSPFRVMIADYAVNYMTVEGESAGIEVEHHLAGREGFLRAFQASQVACGTLDKGSFPRYRKPMDFGTTFFKPLEAESSWREGDMDTVIFAPHWDCTTSGCGVCGLYPAGGNSGVARCRACGEFARCKCADPQWLLVCPTCMEENSSKNK
ncbi:hypothetical protein TI39_contig4112g00002 [Zymoseptoria brevis]|uniref:BTB domain-containing protein n=1 Tax=Zymoseptoria brevis TaxID=1047168 RepID=A0A0F4GDR3_9PEZI|nr:hypothetical protein TI39_contig4112g00002 [Zymoseptoria brevis]